MSNPYEELARMSHAELARQFGLQALIFTGIGLALWSFSGRPILDFLRLDWTGLTFGIALALALIAVAGAFFLGFPRISERLVHMQSRNFAFLKNRLSMPMIVFLSICAGVGEEALFRAGMQTWLADYLPIWLAIGISSAAFALIHFARPVIGAMIFVIGALFGVAYWLTESLLAVMIAHALYDVFAFWFLQKEMHRLNVFAPQPDDLDEAGTES